MLGAGAHGSGVGAGVGFGEAEAAEDFAERHLGQVFLFLLLAAEGVDGIHAQSGLHADEGAHAAVAALEFLGHESVLDGGHAGAAVAVEGGSVEAELAHGLDELFGEASVAVALLDDGNDVLFDEEASVVAHETLVVGEE